MKSKLLVATLVAVLFPLALPAQDEAKVAMKIDVVAWGNDVPGLSFTKARENEAFTARAFRYSDPVTYWGPRILAIHQTVKGQVVEEIPITDEEREHQSIPPAGG
jgi:hypothetical protein